jgi:hypothetical protein
MEACAGRAAGIAGGVAAQGRRRKPSPCATASPISPAGPTAPGCWRRRPPSGLLGGMLGWPGSDWSDAPDPAPPAGRRIGAIPGLEVRHTFTHFHLRLALRVAVVAAECAPRGRRIPDAASAFAPSDLPTVMRKAYDLAATTLRMRIEIARCWAYGRRRGGACRGAGHDTQIPGRRTVPNAIAVLDLAGLVPLVDPRGAGRLDADPAVRLRRGG